MKFKTIIQISTIFWGMTGIIFLAQAQSTQTTQTLTQELTGQTEQSTQQTQLQSTEQTEQLVAPFPDVDIGNKYFSAISYLKQKGLIQGYSDGTFKPDQEINRAEALKLLSNALPKSTTDNTGTTQQQTQQQLEFEDVKSTDWFYQSVLEAFQAGTVSGYPDHLFHPERTINLAEALKICLLREGKNIPEKVEDQPYPDVPVDAWYAPYAQIAKERTLVLSGRTDGTLHGETVLTRAAFANLIYKTIKSSEGSRFVRATWYGNDFANWGTSSGEPFDPDKFTAAHKTLPFGTRILVTNMSNGQHIEVVINDRGPYASGMDLDLSRAAFEAIASLGTGIIVVEYLEIPNVDYSF